MGDEFNMATWGSVALINSAIVYPTPEKYLDVEQYLLIATIFPMRIHSQYVLFNYK